MTLKIKSLLVGAGVLALTACGEGQVGAFFTQPAGAFIDEGGFGNATMHNLLAQKCVGAPKGFIEPDPVVMLQAATATAPAVYGRYSVYCNGRLNGKYAQVIFREYVGSATMPQQISGGGLAVIESQGGE